MTLMNYEYLKKTELTVQSQTDIERNYWFTKLPDLINSIFESNYFIGWDNIENEEQHFQLFANPIYQSVPYSMRVIEMLVHKGYYLESMIIIRTLFEMFIKLRYFFKYKEKCLAYTQGLLKVHYKVMFEEFAPGLYAILYSKLLSEFSHGGFSIGIFHNKIIPPNMVERIEGCFYNESLSNIPINSSMQLFYAYLNYLPILFSKYKVTVPHDINQKRLDNLRWLDNRMDDQMINHPKVKDFYNLLNPLIK